MFKESTRMVQEWFPFEIKEYELEYEFDIKLEDELIKVAKIVELENWKENNVFGKVRYTGQKMCTC